MKSGKLIALFSTIIIFVLLSTIVSASLFSSKDVTFTVNQKDYYFKTGSNAIIPLNISNTYGKQINGLLTYSYTQQMNQGGMSFSSSNSQSITFSVPEGNSVQRLNFGTSKTPTLLTVNLEFTYTDGSAKEVSLNDIKIHFVDSVQKGQNQQQPQTAKSQKYSSSNQQKNSAQNPFSQMQQQLNQMMNQQNTQQQSQTNSVENHQMSQDSSALKKEIASQLKQQEQTQKQFQQTLAKNKAFQQAHQKLLKEGYNLTNAEVNPQTNRTGSFKMQYKKPNGETASLSGTMTNGTIKNLQKDTPETRSELMKVLNQSKEFQKAQTELQKQGFTKKNLDYTQELNKTNVKLTYTNKKNQTATISADVVNKTVKDVTLSKTIDDKKRTWPFLLLLIIIILVAYWFIKKRKKPQQEENNDEKPVVKTEPPFDYEAECKKLLDEAKKLFKEKNYKEAFAKVNQSLRLLLSYENGLKKETTNDELIDYLRKHKKNYKQIKDCFDTCSLVEFAKYTAKESDFEKIVKCTEKQMERVTEKINS